MGANGRFVMSAVSIVITSRPKSRQSDTKQLLASISDQVSKNFEVVYVTENALTYQCVATEARKLGLRVKLIRNDSLPGLSEARNIGALNASGEFIAFVDDDVIVSPDWTRVVEDSFHVNKRIMGITGPAVPLWMNDPANWLPKEFDWLIGCTRWFQSSKMVEVRNCWGMNMAFRRSVFETVGGFSPRTGYHRGTLAEDVEFSFRAKFKAGGILVYVPDLKVLSKVYPYRLSQQFVMERSRWIGHTRREIRRKDNLLGFSFEKMVLFSAVLGVLRGEFLGGVVDVSELIQCCRTLALSCVSLVAGYFLGPL